MQKNSTRSVAWAVLALALVSILPNAGCGGTDADPDALQVTYYYLPG